MQKLYKNIKSLCIPLLLMMGGCASIMMGNYQDIFIETKCGDKPVKAECSVSNEIGEWGVNTPGTVHLHKGYDELVLKCQGDNFEPHKVNFTSSGNLPLYGNALLGGGIGVFTEIETRAGFDYPTKITFIVKSCTAGKPQLEEASKKSKLKEADDESAKSYAVKRGLATAEVNKSESSKNSDKTEVESIQREQAKPKPVSYCKQLDMAIPGCSIQ